MELIRSVRSRISKFSDDRPILLLVGPFSPVGGLSNCELSTIWAIELRDESTKRKRLRAQIFFRVEKRFFVPVGTGVHCTVGRLSDGELTPVRAIQLRISPLNEKG